MTQKKKETTFEMLSKINVNKFVEKKNGLTYLSWAYAWSEVKSNCPDATYEIGETEYDESLGFMCHTSVTIDGETLPMWLPVMDGANKSMKKVAYKFKLKKFLNVNIINFKKVDKPRRGGGRTMWIRFFDKFRHFLILSWLFYYIFSTQLFQYCSFAR